MLLFLEWSAVQWELRANARDHTDLGLNEGLVAYATEQAALQRTLASNFKTLWATPVAEVDNVLHLPDPPIINSNNTRDADNGDDSNKGNGDLTDDESAEDEPDSDEEGLSDVDD